MTDAFIGIAALFTGLAVLLFGGGGLFMLWLAWAYQSFGVLAPLGFGPSVIGFALSAFIITAVFGAGNSVSN